MNQQSNEQTVSLTLEGYPYSVKEVRDYFDDKKIASVHGKSFSVKLPKIDVGSGTKVLRIVSSDDNPSR